MERIRRGISFLLALVMVLGMIPPMAVRAEEPTAPVESTTAPTEAVTEPVAETVAVAETEITVETTGEAKEIPPLDEAAPADGEVKSGIWSQDMTWTLDADGTLTISGSGIVGHPDNWRPITGNAWSGDGVVHLVLEEGITGIGGSVFREIKTLETVTMPAGLVSVGDSSFYNCSALKTMSQAEGLTSLGMYAFYGCSSLEGIWLGEGLQTIPYGAFSGSGLKSLIIPASVVSWSESVFSSCKQLESVSFTEGLTTIGGNAFQGCSSLKTITIPQSVTSIGSRAFQGCSSLKTITIPQSVTSIGDNAFGSCSSLETITLPESDISFGKEVFSYCRPGLKTVTLPDTMTVIPQGMFFRCEELTTVNFPANLKTISQEAFSGCWMLTDMKLPDGLKEIGAEAFLNSNLKTVKFPKGIELIDGLAFDGCSNLKSFEVAEGEDYYSVMDGVLYRLDGKILHAFPAGKETGTFVVPKGVQAIGNGAFSGAEADRIVLQEGVTDIGDNAFRGWTQSVVLPRSLKRIGTNAFIGNLKEVYYFGSEKDWANIEIDDANYGLETATIHYGGVIESGTFGSDFRWELNAVGELVISGSGRMPDFDDYDDIPWMASRGSIVSVKIRKGITHISTNAFWDCPVLVRVTLPDTLKSVGKYAFSQCPKLGEQGTVVYQSTKEEYMHVSIGKNNDALKNARMIFEYVSPYLNDRPIEINGPGKAYAYCSGQPYEEIAYRIGGVAGKATADRYGIIQIPLGSFTTSGFHDVSVEITQVGSRVLDPCQLLEVTVEVKDFSFSQEWEGSVTAAAAAKIGPGFTCTPIGLEANLFALGGSASVGAISKVSRDRDEKTDTLTFTTEVKADVGGSVKSGITKKSHDVEFSFGALSAGVKGGVSGSYGIEIENYKADNLKQQLAVGTYVLEQALTANPNSVLFMPVYAFLADTVYEETGCNVIYGSGFRGSASASADLLGLEVNGTNVITAAGGGAGVSVSFTEKHNNKGVDSKSSSYKTETELSVLSGDAPLNVVNEGLGVKLMGTDVSVGLKKSADSESLQVSSLQGGSGALKLFIFGEYQKSHYVNYQFTDGSLESLKDYSRAIKTYVDGTNQIIGARDVADIANAVSSLYDPIAYTFQDQSEVVYSLPLDIAKACGIEGASLGITLSYKEGNGATTETGYAIHDQHRVVTQSNKKEPTSEEMWTLAQIYTNGLRAIADKVQTFLKKTWGNIKEGVADLRGWVTENVNAGVDWTISLFTFDIPGAKAQSYAIRTMNAGGRALLSNGSNTQQLGSSTTIGQPLVVQVTESGTGEAVTDLSVEPLEFTIRYFEEDLSAAGLSRNDAIVRDGGIAMYRYIEDGDYYVCVGGTNDLEAMTVTAEITSPGQYVLAVDACAPTLKYLDMSDFRETPTITAYIDDLSGLSGKDFRFCIDGVEKVNGNNLSDHYNIAAGIFTYTVPEAEKLSEGEHTLSFTLGDTSENVDTYEYSFQVDLTAPVISSVYVSGQADKDASVWIEAKVNDPNLNLVGVYACISEQQPDGSWGQEVLMDMDYVISDLYTLSYKANGHTIRISVRAVDKAQNQTDSDAVEVRSTKGDVNKDGTIDSQDAVYLLWHVLFPEEYPIHVDADCDQNGTTDIEDVVYLMWHTLFPEMYPLI